MNVNAEGQALAGDRREIVAVVGNRAFVAIDPEVAQVMTLPAFPVGANSIRLQRVVGAMRTAGQLNKPLGVADLADPIGAKAAPKAAPPAN